MGNSTEVERLLARVTALEAEVSRLKRRRIYFRDNDQNQGEAELFLSVKLLQLKREGKLEAYVPGRGRNSPDPDIWIEATLSKLGLSDDERNLASTSPAIWHRVDRRLYFIKQTRQARKAIKS